MRRDRFDLLRMLRMHPTIRNTQVLENKGLLRMNRMNRMPPIYTHARARIQLKNILLILLICNNITKSMTYMFRMQKVSETI
jgi:hypothetical protein